MCVCDRIDRAARGHHLCKLQLTFKRFQISSMLSLHTNKIHTHTHTARIDGPHKYNYNFNSIRLRRQTWGPYSIPLQLATARQTVARNSVDLQENNQINICKIIADAVAEAILPHWEFICRYRANRQSAERKAAAKRVFCIQCTHVCISSIHIQQT